MGRQYLDTSDEACTGSALFNEEAMTGADFLVDIKKTESAFWELAFAWGRVRLKLRSVKPVPV